jgi:translocator protein
MGTTMSLLAWLTPIALLAAVASAAATGALFSPGPWYRTLRKPGWTPPDWLFPIAWTMLYLAMALAAWLVAVSGAPMSFAALALWSWQLVLNAAWSPVFFGLHRIGAALAVILVFWIALALTTWAFYLAAPAAGVLMLPYLAWVSYAAALNLALWWMNPGADRGSVEV